MFYLFTVVIATISIAIANFLYDGVYDLASFAVHFGITAFGVVAVVLIDAIFAFLTRRLPEAWFGPEAKLFSVGKGEKLFYRKTKINVWKKYVPEWGCFTGFHKDKLQSPAESSYLSRFLLESNYGVLGHITGALFGYLIMLIPILRPISVALPIAIVNMILNLLPTMILRANTPALRRLYRGAVEREKRISITNK